MIRAVSFTLNGKPVRLDVDDSRMLLWVLRYDLGLTGTKFGCGMALCGACTVLVDDEPVHILRNGGQGGRGPARADYRRAGARRDAASCPAGVPRTPRLPVRLLHAGHDPGGLRAAAEEAEADARPTSAQALEGNLCRCGSHVRVVQAIQDAAAAPKGGAR